MLRLLMILIPVALAVWAMVDVLQTPDEQLRGMPKVLWVLLILLFTPIGPLVYLFAGKDRSQGRAQRAAQAGPRGYGMAPDDDPEFLERLRLQKWEKDLKDRERKLREDDEDPGKTPGQAPE